MKKLFAAVFTTLILAGGAAPAFAAAAANTHTNTTTTTTTTGTRHSARQYEDHCVFKDKSLCEVKSLSPNMDDNGDV
jgi:phosphoserine aminotransferase